MEKNKYLECLQLLAQNEDLWDEDENGFYYAINPKQTPIEIIDAIELINDNNQAGKQEINDFAKLYGSIEASN